MTTGELEMRYGRKRRLTPTQHYAAITVALLLGVVVAYVVFRNSEQTVQGVVDTAQVTSATSEIVTFEVHKPIDVTGVCVVRARDAAGDEVGRASVTIPAGKPVTYVTYTLKTSSRAITGEVQDCAQADG